jgi:hypothetical protein
MDRVQEGDVIERIEIVRGSRLERALGGCGYAPEKDVLPCGR